ncbi:cyclin-dependent kinase F-4-like [Pyrus ussuriensis x Pyrus communis]|uniref:Cyclin-dependent kinase F-4-like n=1 Tax=Pyrus ussuriensis x Pyrus communis TaxID=2448454 RepID=A0A5N5HBB6_9ROSA|nr:cyclin-dependent kinase F-4-like [Pyrus ussuriensis x Pyrus communis]
MDKFWITKQLGGGSFGTVFEARHQLTGEIVAIKHLRETFSSFEQCVSLPEVQSLSKLRHPNIVQLKDVIFEYDSVFLVFEYMQSSLLDLMMKMPTKFTEEQVRSICYQMFQGLAYIHKKGYFHRDLKPANVLVNDGARVVKIADLGSAKEIDAPPPYTDYVTTRLYRAPEVLLQSGLYGPKVDMWAMGAIMAELFSFQPLFPGQSPDDQMFKICSVIGSPTWESWPEGQLLAQNLNYQFPQLHGVGLPAMIPSASRSAIQLISSLCSWDPSARPTADEVLRHPFFVGNYKIPRAIPWRQSNILPTSNSIIFV